MKFYDKPIAQCTVFNKKKNIYLASVESCFNDHIDYGTCFTGCICIELTEKQIDKLSNNNFEDIDIDEVLKVVIDDIELEFYPYMWLF